ncbi:unnamed protein product [Arabis nemorensis]|uniref:Uncharacterized protein n=1 Tax=Arabis nemorensis TaxID=586526 RepID=A0A565BIH9_9BRAS|nr:unnamed protein product [Arabis nemorensis]
MVRLVEKRVAFEIVHVDLMKGDQRQPEYLTIQNNDKLEMKREGKVEGNIAIDKYEMWIVFGGHDGVVSVRGSMYPFGHENVLLELISASEKNSEPSLVHVDTVQWTEVPTDIDVMDTVRWTEVPTDIDVVDTVRWTEFWRCIQCTWFRGHQTMYFFLLLFSFIEDNLV